MLPQDQSLADATGEFPRVDRWLRLLLLQHVLGVLVEVEGLLPSLLLHQQDHQAAQGVFVCWLLFQGRVEQLLGLTRPPVPDVQVDQLEERAVPRPAERVAPRSHPLGVQVVLEEGARGERERLLKERLRTLPLALGA